MTPSLHSYWLFFHEKWGANTVLMEIISIENHSVIPSESASRIHYVCICSLSLNHLKFGHHRLWPLEKRFNTLNEMPFCMLILI